MKRPDLVGSFLSFASDGADKRGCKLLAVVTPEPLGCGNVGGTLFAPLKVARRLPRSFPKMGFNTKSVTLGLRLAGPFSGFCLVLGRQNINWNSTSKEMSGSSTDIRG